MEAVQRPVARSHGIVLVRHRGPHVDPVGDARRVGDDQRRSRPRLGLGERLDRLDVVRTDRDLRDVDVAVASRFDAEVLLRGVLAAGRELRHRGAGRGLRGLPARVRVHLGVEHEDVHVATRPQHVVETSGADVVGPTVAPDDPHVLAHERARQRVRAHGRAGRSRRRRRRRAGRGRRRARRSGTVAPRSWHRRRAPPGRPRGSAVAQVRRRATARAR